jgi:phosphatidylinositol-3-phosphatase
MSRFTFTHLAAVAVAAILIAAGLSFPAQATTNAPVVVIVLENHGYGPTDNGVNNDPKKYIVGNTTNAPYINNTLIPSGRLFTNYFANHHPSLPDYLEMTSGSDGGCQVDSCARDSIPGENLFHLLGQAGIGFQSLLESMPSNCKLANVNDYLVRHNPEAYYTNIDAASGLPYSCPNTDLGIAAASSPGTALDWPATLPPFTFIAANRCGDMHGSPANGTCPSNTTQIVQDGDTWLSANVPALLALGAVVIVTFDEGASGDSRGGGGHVMTVVTGPNVPAGTTDGTAYTHDSLLAGLEDYFGVSPLLGAAATATPLPIPRATPYTVPTITGLTPEEGAPGDHVTIAGTGLTNTYAVRFGGAAATFSVDSDTQLTATVPNDAVTGTVTASTIGGTATSPDTFTVDGPPPPPQPTLQQHAAGSAAKSKTASVAWGSTTQAGDLQVAALSWTGAPTITPPSGWSLAVSAGTAAIYYRQNAPATSGNVTFTFSANANWVLAISEWSGVKTTGAYDKSAHASSGTATGGTASSGTTAVTSQPVELVIAGIKAVANVTESSPTNGFALLDQAVGGANDTLGTLSLVTSTAAKRSTSVSLSTHAKWRGVIATFRGA